jgi:hypothetical protein
LSNAVRAHVRSVTHGSFYNIDRLPFLRPTAWQTWTHAEGVCGDGARLIVLLLLSQGIRASRIDLFGPPNYTHTVVAYRDGDQWYLVNSTGSAEFHAWISSRPRRYDAVPPPGRETGASMKTLAAIDIGTNSIKLLVANVEEDGTLDVVLREKEMVRLGSETLRTSTSPDSQWRPAMSITSENRPSASPKRK